jgi:hypothetical protein
MSHNIHCYRCGTSLAAMSLPLSRQDECPECTVYLHVCRMCKHYDPQVTRQCREDGAEDVIEKERVNFCDWFLPSESAFDSALKSKADTAKQSLDALFDESDSDVPEVSAGDSDAESLFK